MANTNLNSGYALDGSNNQIILEVTIGHAQLGVTAIAIDGNPFVNAAANASGNYDGSFSIALGTNAELAGSILSIVPTVDRIQPNIAATSVQIKLSGGVADSNYPLLSADAAAQGDVINYTALINFN